MFNIVLLNPQIPQNTGTIGRTCVGLNAKLHLIKPYGFEISEKKLRRAGLDYWDKLNYQEYDNLKQFYDLNKIETMYFLTTKANKSYYDKAYKPNDYFMFGREDKGICESILNKKNNINNCIKIPMQLNTRSLNLSNAVCIVAYEALRQNIKNFKLI
jgi:tRNA (cytidine/uridine-2'-O-)-methyltransferase